MLCGINRNQAVWYLQSYLLYEKVFNKNFKSLPKNPNFVYILCIKKESVRNERFFSMCKKKCKISHFTQDINFFLGFGLINEIQISIRVSVC